MAKTNIGQFSTTAGSNTDVDSVSLAEGQLPGLLNNGIRALMALLAEAWDDLQGYTASGTDNYTVSTTTTYTADAEIGLLVVTFTNGNTGASDLNVDTIGASNITKNGGNALVSGDIAAGSTHALIHDGTNWEIVGQLVTSSPQFTTIELGHASDTTLARSGAGVVTIEGVEVTTNTATQTLTNKTLGAVTLSGAVTGADQTVSSVNLKDYGEVTNALGDLGGGTDDIDVTAGNVVTATVSTSTQTFTFSNPTASDEGCGFTLVLTNGGSQTVNWPASVDWAGGTAPTLTSSGVDILEFFTVDGGTTWHGFASGLDMQ